MKLIDLLAMVVAGVESKEMQDVTEIEIAKVASDIYIKRRGKTLQFSKTLIAKKCVTPSLLNTAFVFAPFIIFTYDNNHWTAEQTYSKKYFNRMLEFKETENSIRIAIIGADIHTSSTLDILQASYKNTTILSLDIRRVSL